MPRHCRRGRKGSRAEAARSVAQEHKRGLHTCGVLLLGQAACCGNAGLQESGCGRMIDGA